MSEASETLPKPMIANALMGAASPLWGYFAGAAMGGVAFWWAAKLAQPTTYQALAERLAHAEPRTFAATEAAAEVPFVAAAEAVTSGLSVVGEVAKEASSPPANEDAA